MKNTSSAKLWDGLGGEQVLAKAVDRFIDLATTDPKVNYSRGGRYPINDATLRFSKRAALEFISAATGGPYRYSGKTIREIHAGMEITDQEFDAITANFRRALEENGVSQEMVQLAVGRVNATRSYIVEPR
jgi:hemoglobin